MDGDTIDQGARADPAGPGTAGPGTAGPGTDARRVAVVINREAGGARGRDEAALAAAVVEACAGLGTVGAPVVTGGAGLATALERVFADPAVDLVVVGGGDGSASTAAALAIRHDKPLGVLPLGTFNLFARLSGFPPTLDGTLAAIRTAEPVRVDVGRVGDRFFLHHVSVGAHPHAIRLREASGYSGRWSKMLAGLRAWSTAMLDPPRLRLTIRADDHAMRGSFANVMVTVNELAETPSMAPLPADPLGGRLALYATRTTTPRAFVLFVLYALAGRWRSNPLAAFARARRVAISTRSRRLIVSFDGEPIEIEGSLEAEVAPAALTVLRAP